MMSEIESLWYNWQRWIGVSGSTDWEWFVIEINCYLTLHIVSNSMMKFDWFILKITITGYIGKWQLFFQFGLFQLPIIFTPGKKFNTFFNQLQPAYSCSVSFQPLWENAAFIRFKTLSIHVLYTVSSVSDCLDSLRLTVLSNVIGWGGWLAASSNCIDFSKNSIWVNLLSSFEWSDFHNRRDYICSGVFSG